jgi:hypothetical protein
LFCLKNKLRTVFTVYHFRLLKKSFISYNFISPYFCPVSFESDFFHSLHEPKINFEVLALKLFRHQAENIPAYKQFLELLHTNPDKVTQVKEIPFLPVAFFKSNKILKEDTNDNIYFTSSTTTGGTPSKHYVPDLGIYEWSFKNSFQTFYKENAAYCILGLLPSYIERGGSSLVYMVEHFINESKYSQNGFYLDDFKALHQQLSENEKAGISTLLIGVTYALLDFAEQFPMELKNTIVMETGGMKGRREEMLRAQVHQELKKAFKTDKIHSEYGMTELLSQAYSKGDGIFMSPPWMRVFIADLNDAMTILPSDKTGSINIIDLANIYSCAFIATDDLGIVHQNSSFEIIGRKDSSDIRGCGLMYRP